MTIPYDPPVLNRLPSLLSSYNIVCILFFPPHPVNKFQMNNVIHQLREMGSADPKRIEKPGRLLVEIPAGLDPGGHFRNLELGDLERGKRLSKLFPASNVLDRLPL